ncbi:MAG: hypothetical protein V4738_05940 [Pseudomonadota bacterium]
MATPDTILPLPASSRLQQSRQALLVQLGRAEPPSHGEEPAANGPSAAGSGGQWWRLLKRTAQRWWQRHPASTVTEVAMPLLGAYTRQEPLKVLGLAALLGAAVVVTRPWRLLSAGALLAATFRPADMSALVLSMLTQVSADTPRHNPATPDTGGMP